MEKISFEDRKYCEKCGHELTQTQSHSEFNPVTGKPGKRIEHKICKGNPAHGYFEKVINLLDAK